MLQQSAFVRSKASFRRKWCFSTIPNFFYFRIVFNLSISIYQLLQLQLEFSTIGLCAQRSPLPEEVVLSTIPNFFYFRIVFNLSISIYQLLQLQLEFSTIGLCAQRSPPFGRVWVGLMIIQRQPSFLKFFPVQIFIPLPMHFHSNAIFNGTNDLAKIATHTFFFLYRI